MAPLKSPHNEGINFRGASLNTFNASNPKFTNV